MSYNFAKTGAGYLQEINASNYEEIALALFQYQYFNNKLYRDFTNALQIRPEAVTRLTDIPFLPISFFKTHEVKSGDWDTPALYFESSGTTGETPSRHYVYDNELYNASLLKGFKKFYGDPAEYTIVALLPSYLERGNASLVYMVELLMEQGKQPLSGFYLDEWDKLSAVLQELEQKKQKTLLIGVTFALLDFAEAYPMELKNTIVMETGGMKGRKTEWTRSQVHDYLKERWQLENVHSEYGMTELLSQAYARENGIFECANTMKLLVRDINDPLEVMDNGVGCINIIDLANVHSCAFIATDDIGRLGADGRFEVLGRMDHAALRGCSLMVL